jgi:hypothetical protein
LPGTTDGAGKLPLAPVQLMPPRRDPETNAVFQMKFY